MGQTKWSEPKVSEDFIRILEPSGVAKGEVPNVAPEELLKWYRSIVRTRAYEDMTIRMQRRGELSVTAQSRGEEAIGVGAMAALQAGDLVYPSYRQFSGHLYWNAPLARAMAGLFGAAPETIVAHLPIDEVDLPKVQFMPYGVILASQVTHAVGSAMADQLQGSTAVTMTFTGEGSTSEGDFHDALNFAGVFKAPCVIIVVNNGWSISVPASRQTGSATFAEKASAYGLPGARVDGNDVLAVYQTVSEAVARARSGEGSTLVECVTYRVVDHNTSDSSEVYRDDEQAAYWRTLDPLDRFTAYLEGQGILTDETKQQEADEAKAFVEAAAELARSVPRSTPETMFEHHLQGEPSWAERVQRAELQAELEGRNPFLADHQPGEGS
ncbi:MAG: thiamine pyrophosphate-dependent enzyme [Gammaproteobacteria bacterium]|nr:thiamine pyrophosphate-dependent enzyme [Gammaproteobacteria bacterium]